MAKKWIILTVGLPRSGKTTWALEQKGIPIVSPDSVRLALHGKRFEILAEDMVWTIVFVMIRALFLAGHNTIIVDATHTTAKRRQPYMDKFPNCQISFVHIDTPKEECIKRAVKENDSAIIPIIEKMDAQFELEGLEFKENLVWTTN